VKPFTARELLARVKGRLGLARERRVAAEELTGRLAELEKANAEIRDGRRAALNVLEDALEARDRAERLNRDLRDSEERFRKLVEVNAQAVWETNAAGEVVADSPSWRAYTGQTFNEWKGYGWVNAVHPDDRGFAERQWREAVAAGRDVNAEFRLKCARGGWRWTNVRATPLLNADGSIRKWVGMNIDIDARKRAEDALHPGVAVGRARKRG
jgi:PAS domain S-box-containing protein